MYVEERIYTLHPGKLPAFLKIYEEKGYGPQRDILGPPVGWYTADIGELNQVVHLWAYTSLDDRETRRVKLYADDQFKEYLTQIFPLLVKMENRILKPAPFFAEPLRKMLATWEG